MPPTAIEIPPLPPVHNGASGSTSSPHRSPAIGRPRRPAQFRRHRQAAASVPPTPWEATVPQAPPQPSPRKPLAMGGTLVLGGSGGAEWNANLGRAEVQTPLPVSESPVPPDVLDATMNLMGLLRAVGTPTPQHSRSHSHTARPPAHPPAGGRRPFAGAAPGTTARAISQARLNLEKAEKEAVTNRAAKEARRKREGEAVAVLAAACKARSASMILGRLRVEELKRREEAQRQEAERREEARRQEEIRRRNEPSVDELIAYLGLEPMAPESRCSSHLGPVRVDVTSPSLPGECCHQPAPIPVAHGSAEVLVLPDFVESPPQTAATGEIGVWEEDTVAASEDAAALLAHDTVFGFTPELPTRSPSGGRDENHEIASRALKSLLGGAMGEANGVWAAAEHVGTADEVLDAEEVEDEGWQIAGTALGGIFLRSLQRPAASSRGRPSVDELLGIPNTAPLMSACASARSLDVNDFEGISLAAGLVNSACALGGTDWAQASSTRLHSEAMSLFPRSEGSSAPLQQRNDKELIVENSSSGDLSRGSPDILCNPRAWAGGSPSMDETEDVSMFRVLSSELVAMACAEHDSSSAVSVTLSNTWVGGDCSEVDLEFALACQVVGGACADGSDSSAIMSLDRSAGGSPESVLAAAAFGSPTSLAKLDLAPTAEVFGSLFANGLLHRACDEAADSDSDVWSIGSLGDSSDLDVQRLPLTGAAAAVAAAAADAECAARAAEDSAVRLAARAATRQAALEIELGRPEADREHERLALKESAGAVCGGLRSFIARDVCSPSSASSKIVSRTPTRPTSVSSRIGDGPGNQTPRGAALHAVRAVASARLE